MPYKKKHVREWLHWLYSSQEKKKVNGPDLQIIDPL